MSEQIKEAKESSIYELKLHEYKNLGFNTEIMAVPGGWIYTVYDEGCVGTTFVPMPEVKVEFKEYKPKKLDLNLIDVNYDTVRQYPSIDEAGLSSGLSNTLKMIAHGEGAYQDISFFSNFTEKEILKFRRFGNTKLEELRSVLLEYSLNFKDE